MTFPPSSVWFITGASLGLGRALAESALAAGDRVVFAVRDPSRVADLVASYPEAAHAVAIDVTDFDRIPSAVEAALSWAGRIDVLVNNAGRGHIGAVEEAGLDELRAQLDLHLIGPVALVRALLPSMRAHRSGTIVQISSQGGRMSFGGVGVYSASKFALEGVSEALAREVAGFGIRVIIVEPGALRTSFNEPAALVRSIPMPEYAQMSGAVARNLAVDHGRQPGDPQRAATVIRRAVAAENPPLRLRLGSDAVRAVGAALRADLADLEKWRVASESVDFPADGRETGARRPPSSSVSEPSRSS